MARGEAGPGSDRKHKVHGNATCNQHFICQSAQEMCVLCMSVSAHVRVYVNVCTHVGYVPNTRTLCQPQACYDCAIRLGTGLHAPEMTLETAEAADAAVEGEGRTKDKRSRPQYSLPASSNRRCHCGPNPASDCMCSCISTYIHTHTRACTQTHTLTRTHNTHVHSCKYSFLVDCTLTHTLGFMVLWCTHTCRTRQRIPSSAPHQSEVRQGFM